MPAITVRGRTVLSARVMGKVYSPASIVLRGVDLELVGGRVQGCSVQTERARACSSKFLRNSAFNVWQHLDRDCAKGTVRRASEDPRERPSAPTTHHRGS
jgi:hypothetical protein